MEPWGSPLFLCVALGPWKGEVGHGAWVPPCFGESNLLAVVHEPDVTSITQQQQKNSKERENIVYENRDSFTLKLFHINDLQRTR